jgi:hypothetical protein
VIAYEEEKLAVQTEHHARGLAVAFACVDDKGVRFYLHLLRAVHARRTLYLQDAWGRVTNCSTIKKVKIMRNLFYRTYRVFPSLRHAL